MQLRWLKYSWMFFTVYSLWDSLCWMPDWVALSQCLFLWHVCGKKLNFFQWRSFCFIWGSQLTQPYEGWEGGRKERGRWVKKFVQVGCVITDFKYWDLYQHNSLSPSLSSFYHLSSPPSLQSHWMARSGDSGTWETPTTPTRRSSSQWWVACVWVREDYGLWNLLYALGARTSHVENFEWSTR